MNVISGNLDFCLRSINELRIVDYYNCLKVIFQQNTDCIEKGNYFNEIFFAEVKI